jgi:hypothetical protein
MILQMVLPLVLQGVIFDQAFIGETVIAVVADDQVIQHSDLHGA